MRQTKHWKEYSICTIIKSAANEPVLRDEPERRNTYRVLNLNYKAEKLFDVHDMQF